MKIFILIICILYFLDAIEAFFVEMKKEKPKISTCILRFILGILAIIFQSTLL